MSQRKKVVATFPEHTANTCFREEDLARLDDACEFVRCHAANEDADAYHAACEGASVILTGWGSPQVDEEAAKRAGNLELVSHAAGSVAQLVSPEAWDAGVRVSTANNVLGHSVAVTALGVIICSLKQLFTAPALIRPMKKFPVRENIRPIPREVAPGVRIGVVGYGAVGRPLVKMLNSIGNPEILVSDPGVNADEIEQAGATLTDLDTVCSTCDVVVNCVPWNPKTENLFGAKQLSALPEGSIYINVGRGATVDEAALIAELQKGPERMQAYLDVQHPEPPVPESAFYDLENCFLFPHVAGFVGNGRLNLGAFAAEEVLRFLQGDTLLGEVSRSYAEGMTGSKVK